MKFCIFYVNGGRGWLRWTRGLKQRIAVKGAVFFLLGIPVGNCCAADAGQVVFSNNYVIDNLVIESNGKMPQSEPESQSGTLDRTVELSVPHPLDNPESPLMFNVSPFGTDPSRIDYSSLPRIASSHAVVSDVRNSGGARVNQHVYLRYHSGKYWAMWSDGPGVPIEGVSAEDHRNRVPAHDRPGTRVAYATSEDGLRWSAPGWLSEESGAGVRIARGFWVRDGELLALTGSWHHPGWTDLRLDAYRWDETQNRWVFHGLVYDDALNNFQPEKLPDGRWMMTRRTHERNTSVLIGGIKGFDQWEDYSFSGYTGTQLPEEPEWYTLPDGNLVGLARDNAGSNRLLRGFSSDGRNWSRLVKTNFPDAKSKFYTLRTSRGYYALVSNSNPAGRDVLTLAISQDGLVYTHLFYLVGGRHVDYPHIIENGNHLFVAFSSAKQTTEVLRISLDDVDAMIVNAGAERSTGGTAL